MGMNASRWVVASVFVIGSCTGDATNGDADGGASRTSDDGTSAGDGTGAGSLDGDGDGDTEGDGNGTGAGGCDDVELPETMQVDVVIANQTADTIYLDPFRGKDDGCDERFPFAVTRHDTEASVVHDLPGCPTMCSAAASLCNLEGCPGACSNPQPIRIEAGGRHTIEWTPVEFRETELSAACVPCDDPPSLACWTQDALDQAADYELTVWAASSPNCDACDCDPGPDGSCIIESGAFGVVDPRIEADTITTGLPSTITVTFR